jgi:cyclase
MQKGFVPERMGNLIRQFPENAAAATGYRLVPPQIEYRDKMTLHVGERTIEVFYLKNVHSEADSAVWLPQERVLFSASVAIPNQINILRPFVTIPDMLSAMRMLKALNPEVVVPGHGTPGTTKIFDDSERYYALLMERVGAQVRAGKTLDQIKAEVKMPEYASYTSQDRMPTNIEAAYRAVQASR